MVVSLILTVIFCILILCRFKRGIIISAMTLQLLSYLGTGIPTVKIFFLISILAFILYPMSKKQLSHDAYPKWLTMASCLFLISFALTTVNSGYMHWQTVVVNAFSYFFFPFVFWKCLDSAKRVNLAFSVLVKLMTIAVIFGVIEAFFRVNLVFNLIQNVFAVEDFSFDDDRVRFGLKRCNSIFSYFSTYGIAAFMTFIALYVRCIMFKYKSKWQSALMLLCAFAAFSTGSRATFLGLFLACYMLLINKKFLKTKTGRKFLVISFLLLPVLCVVGYQVADSIINSNTSQYAGGSTSDLREIQWEACLPYFLESPILGNGRLYIWDVVKEAHYELLGAESIWFSIMVDYGILGAVAFLFLIFACGKELWRLNWRLICLPVGYLLILSLSPDTGITYNVLISFTVLIIRMFQFKTNRQNV